MKNLEAHKGCDLLKVLQLVLSNQYSNSGPGVANALFWTAAYWSQKRGKGDMRQTLW